MKHLNKYLERGFREIYSKNPKITKQEMAKELDLSIRSIYRYCSLTGIKLKDTSNREEKCKKYLESIGYTFD